MVIIIMMDVLDEEIFDCGMAMREVGYIYTWDYGRKLIKEILKKEKEWSISFIVTLKGKMLKHNNIAFYTAKGLPS
jgi:hypothetical protein